MSGSELEHATPPTAPQSRLPDRTQTDLEEDIEEENELMLDAPSPSRRPEKRTKSVPDALSELEARDESDDIIVPDAMSQFGVQDQIDDATAKTIASTLYGVKDDNGHIRWQKRKPAGSKPRPSTSGYPIVLRYLLDDDSETKSLKLSSVLVRSEYLKDVVQRVFARYPGQAVHAPEPTFAAPLHPFCHQWAMFEDELQKVQGSEGSDLSQLLTLGKFVQEEVGEIMNAAKSMARAGQTTFDTLWTLFPPGVPVIGHADGTPQCFLVQGTNYQYSPYGGGMQFVLTLLGLDHDGKNFGWRPTIKAITSFLGTYVITDLSVVPLHHHAEAADVIHSATMRGSAVAALLKEKTSYKSHEGSVLIPGHGPPGTQQKVHAAGRIITDPVTHAQQRPDQAVTITIAPGSLQPIVPRRAQPVPSQSETQAQAQAQAMHLAQRPQLMQVQQFQQLQAEASSLYNPYGQHFQMPATSYDPAAPFVVAAPTEATEGATKDPGIFTMIQNFDSHFVLGEGPTKLSSLENSLTDKSALLDLHRWTEDVFHIHPEAFCHPAVRGYCLTLKAWTSFRVQNISDIKWNANAFEALVIPPARKTLLEALVKQQSVHKTDAEIDDVIAGKGQGLVLLLTGPPGTGKTLTAESIADHLHIPLYAVSASELGDTVAEIEQHFGQALRLAASWNAVLLLDEADAFLEKRDNSPEARERNKRVAGEFNHHVSLSLDLLRR